MNMVVEAAALAAETDGLPAILAAMRVADDGVHACVPESWLQGRTAYGGLSTTLALAAVLKQWDDLPPLRSAQISFIGPLAGTVAIKAELLRRGRTAAFVQVDVRSQAGLGLRAMFVFMTPQLSHVDLAPPVLVADALPPLGAPFTPPRSVAFAQHFEFRSTGVAADTAHLQRWVRLRARGGLGAMTELLAIGDVLPPAAIQLFTRHGPISSMNWQVNMLSEQPATRDGWWLVEALADHARDGASSQQMRIWNSDGVLVATAMQAVALFV